MKQLFFTFVLCLLSLIGMGPIGVYGQESEAPTPLELLELRIQEANNLLENSSYRSTQKAEEVLYEIDKIRANGYLTPGDLTPLPRNEVMKYELKAYLICAQSLVIQEEYKEANRYANKGSELALSLDDMVIYAEFNQLQQEIDYRLSSEKKGLGRFLHSVNREFKRKVAPEFGKVEDEVTRKFMQNAESKARQSLGENRKAEAGQYYLEALQYADKLDDSLLVLEFQTKLTSIYMDLGKYEEARKVAESNRQARIADEEFSYEEGETSSENVEDTRSALIRPVEIGKPKPLDVKTSTPLYDEFAEGLKPTTRSSNPRKKVPANLSVSKQLARLEASLKRKWEDSIVAAEFINKNQAEIKKLRFESRLDSLMLEEKEFALREKRNQISYFVIGLAAIISLSLLLYILFSYQKRINKKLKLAYDQLKSAQLQLVESEKMASLGQLTAGVAHEINNPVNFISGNVIPLRRDMEDLLSILDSYEDEVVRQGLEAQFLKIEQEKKRLDLAFVKEEIQLLLEGIEEGASRTAEIVKELRNFVRMDELSPKPFDIHQGLDSTLALLKHKTDEVEIVKQYATLPLLVCLPGKLNQVFMNLLSNAIQADSTHVLIETSLPSSEELPANLSNGAVLIKIEDNGKGIPKEILPYIFDPFYTTKDVGEGTGLGLSISKGIVEQHRGKLTIESVEGQGTTVNMLLPIEGIEDPETLSSTPVETRK